MIVVICIAFFYDQTQIFYFGYIDIYEIGLSVGDHMIFAVQLFTITFDHIVYICFVSKCLVCTDTDACGKSAYALAFQVNAQFCRCMHSHTFVKALFCAFYIDCHRISASAGISCVFEVSALVNGPVHIGYIQFILNLEIDRISLFYTKRRNGFDGCCARNCCCLCNSYINII